MPRKPAPDSRERILSAAGRLFYTRGVRAVGMAEVTQAAGCGKNLVYTHFPSKDDLVAAYLREFSAERDRVETALADTSTADPREALVALVDEVAARRQDPRFRGCPFRNYLREFGSDEGEAGQAAVEWLRRSRQRVEELVREAGLPDPDSVTDQIWLVLDGLYTGPTLVDPRRGGAAATAMVRRLLGWETPPIERSHT